MRFLVNFLNINITLIAARSNNVKLSASSLNPRGLTLNMFFYKSLRIGFIAL